MAHDIIFCSSEFIQHRIIERNPLYCVLLSSVGEANRTQSTGFSSIRFVRLLRKSFGVRFGSIAEHKRTQSVSLSECSFEYAKSYINVRCIGPVCLFIQYELNEVKL